MEHFLPIDNMDQMDVNHKDENKANNIITNLEWLSHKDNMNYGTRNIRGARRGADSVRSKKVLCIETQKIYPALREVERQLGIAATHISVACKNPRRTAGGYHWEYVEEKQNEN